MVDTYKYFALLIGLILISTGLVGAGTQPPPEGGILPEFTLSVPISIEHQKYLGLAGNKPFTITEIKAEVVIVEIFSMY